MTEKENRIMKIDMTIKELTEGCGTVSCIGNTDIRITAVTDDSRKVTAGTMFVAVKGFASDGHAYIGSAIGKGAAADIPESRNAIAVIGVYGGIAVGMI